MKVYFCHAAMHRLRCTSLSISMLLFGVAVLLTGNSVRAQDLQLDYAASFTGVYDGVVYPADIAVDGSGNSYIAGSFSGTADFDPGAGTFLLSSAEGTSDIFIEKLNSSGALVWVVAIGAGGTGADDGAEAIAVDASGDVYITGNLANSADFDPGPGTSTLVVAGFSESFVLKLDTSGVFVWANVTDGSFNAAGYDIAVDAAESVYVTGSFSGILDLDPGVTVFNRNASGPGDIFVQKLDASGGFIWGASMGGSGDDHGRAIAVDGSQNVYITGTFYSTVDFDPGAGTANRISAGQGDQFVEMLDASGAFGWVTAIGGTLSEAGYGIALDASTNVYTTGLFESASVDFDPGAGTTALSASTSDTYVQKLTSAGVFVWARDTQGSGYDSGKSIAVDSAGNVIITGDFLATVDFDPGAGTQNRTSTAVDSFVQKLDSSGNFVSALGSGGSLSESGFSVTTDASNNVYTVGTFTGSFDLDPGAGTQSVTQRGRNSAYIQALDSSNGFLFGGSLVCNNAEDGGRSVAVDAAGNVFVTGAFTGIVDFDPGAGVATLTSAGDSDIFVAKLDADGDYLWAVNLGGAGFESGASLAVDETGNVIVVGDFTGTIDFNPGVETSNLVSVSGNNDIFALKLSGSGAFVWARSFRGTNTKSVRAIAADASGNLLITGFFNATVDFDPGAGTANLSSNGATRDIFVVKLNSSGNYVWARSAGSSSFDEARGIAVDGNGNSAITGSFTGTVDFDPGVGTTNLTSAGNRDIFVLKLNSSGDFLWARRSGGAVDNDEGYGIAFDQSGAVFVTGTFADTADFDPGAGTTNLTSAGVTDIFLQKLDTSGNFVWASRIGSSGFDAGLSVDVDGSGNVSTTGYFGGMPDFDPGPGTFNLNASPASDIYAAKFENNGDFLWAGRLGRGYSGLLHANDVFGTIAVEPSGNAIVTGRFFGTQDFDPGVGAANLTAAGFGDTFMWKLGIIDTDGDELADWDENNIHGTNPNDADSDGDGLLDGEEVNVYFTDPLVTDSDADTVDDGEEVELGMDPTLDDYANGSTGAINDLSTQQFQVVVAAGSPVQQISDINVRLNISHTFDANLSISLTSPSGTTVALASNLGGSDDNYTNTWLDDEAATVITGEAAPFTGHFQPSQPLTAFDTEDPQGTWTLTIQDQTAGDSGSLTDWGLSMTTVNRAFQFSPVWVNFAAGAGGNGSISLPFNTLTEALTRVETAGRVKILAGVTIVTPTINQNVRLEASGGTVRIGAP